MADAITDVLDEADRRAERLIGFMRIAVALALGVVFNATVVGAAPPEDLVVATQLTLARLTLIFCLVLGCVAVLVSSRALYRPAYAYGFVAADVTFVIASLWFALQNTQMPAGYVVLLPSAWLVPLILALNALRYRAGAQALGGVLVVGGLVFLGMLEPAGTGMPATNLGQTPPNVMRLAMIAVASAVLFLAVRRARRTLVRAIGEERQRREFGRYLPPQVADIIASDSGSLTAGRRQNVVVLFVDIRAFTARSEAASPEEVGAFLATFRTLIVEAANATGGLVDKFVGDGALVIFGVPDPKPEDGSRALACAGKILAAMEAWSARRVAEGEDAVAIGIGIHAGDAFVGALDGGGRLEFTVLGDTVNVAARLEEATKLSAASAFASKAVTRDVKAKAAGITLTDCGKISLRGRSEPVAVVAVAPRV